MRAILPTGRDASGGKDSRSPVNGPADDRFPADGSKRRDCLYLDRQRLVDQMVDHQRRGWGIVVVVEHAWNVRSLNVLNLAIS